MNKNNLAVYTQQKLIIESISKNQVTVIEAPTGSGKTTQLPQIIINNQLNEGGLIGVTQPRRIATYSVSKRIAEEMEVTFGEEVGYKMRFEDFTTPATMVKIMTDGILLQEIKTDPLLEKYSIIIIDEAHERSLNIDFILGLLKNILLKRKDFKIVISSATINASLFSLFFNNAPIISIKTNPFPIDILYKPLKRENNPDEIIFAISKIVKAIIKKGKEGDILIFLPGEKLIKDCISELDSVNMRHGGTLELLPLYGRLSAEDQHKVFNSFPDKRKVIVSTNIAETSITIDGVTTVIDSGIAKLNFYNSRTFSNILETKSISTASSLQRMGRAGRTAPGEVYRLYSKKNFQEREQYTKEEIYRSDLTEVVLRMADFGIKDYTSFDFISPPSRGAILSAIDTLKLIDAINHNGDLTEIGKIMAEFPIEPRLARILLEALIKFPEVTDQVLVIIAFLSAKSPFLYPPEQEMESRRQHKLLRQKGGDFATWLALFKKYREMSNTQTFCDNYFLDKKSMDEVFKIHDQLKQMLLDRNYPIGESENLSKVLICAATGLVQYICHLDYHGSYKSMTEKNIRIHPGSFLSGSKAKWVIAGDVFITARIYIRSAAEIDETSIKKHFPNIYSKLSKNKSSKYDREDKRDKHKKSERFQKDNNEANKIFILDKFFNTHIVKHKIVVDLPYNILIQLKDKKKLLKEYDFKDMIGRITYKNKIIALDKLNNILKYFDAIEISEGIIERWPRNRKLYLPDNCSDIYRNIALLGRPVQIKRKSKYSGFLALQELGDDCYTFYAPGDFFESLEMTIDALESLIENKMDIWTPHEKSELEDTYNRLLRKLPQ